MMGIVVALYLLCFIKNIQSFMNIYLSFVRQLLTAHQINKASADKGYRHCT